MKKLSVFRLTTFTAIFSLFVTIAMTSSLSFAQTPASSPDPVKETVPPSAGSANPSGGIAGILNGKGEGSNSDDYSGQGLDEVYQEIQTDVATLGALSSSDAIHAHVRFSAPNYQKMSSAVGAYKNHRDDCISRQQKAAYACLENLSSNIQDAITAINPLMALAGVAVNDACSSFSTAMNIAKGAMTAYTAICGTMKAGCGYSCVAARDALNNIVTGAKADSGKVTCVPSTIDDPQNQNIHREYLAEIESCTNLKRQYNDYLGDVLKAADKDLTPADGKSIAGKAEVCTKKYAALAISAVSGIASLGASLAQSNKCDNNTSGSSTTSTTATNTDTCSIAANAQLPECICKANPRLAGCDNTLQKSGQSTTAAMQAVSSPNAGTTSSTGGLSSADLASTGTDGAPGPASSDSSPGGVGAPVGGGGAALSGGGGGTGSGSAADGSNGKKALNANILGGAGGGGGGGSWGLGGGSGSSSAQYRPYLPGGEKDPNKAAGAQAWTKEVTGQGGKSNWEKVKDRYRDNNATLLNN